MKRILTAAVLVPLLWALLVLAPAWAFDLTVAVVLVGAMVEAYAILAATGSRPLRVLGVLCALALAATFVSRGNFEFPLELALVVAVVATAVGSMAFRREPSEMVGTMHATLLPVLLVGWTLAHFIGLRARGDTGKDLILLLCLCVMLGDTAAYYVGSAIGRRKMAPRLSPNKSWEGGLAGMLASVAAAWLAQVWFFPELPATHVPAVGALLGVAGIAGDLAVSSLKRAAGVKDSGRLLPGHGGVLDRTDSLLFAAPVLYYYAKTFLPEIP